MFIDRVVVGKFIVSKSRVEQKLALDGQEHLDHADHGVVDVRHDWIRKNVLSP
jgi:hypothetical protein